MAAETIEEKIKIGQLLDKNNKPVTINLDFKEVSLTFNAVKVIKEKTTYSGIVKATTDKDGFIYLNNEDEIKRVSEVLKKETVTFNTSGIFGYEDTINIVSNEDFDSKNLKIVLTIKSYTPEEKVDLIIKNAKALKEKVVKALETRFKQSPREEVEQAAQ
jgi:hypothetical protein